MATPRASNPSLEEKQLETTQGKADAIRRGTLKISAPLSVDEKDVGEDGSSHRSAISLRVHSAISEKRSQYLRDADMRKSCEEPRREPVSTEIISPTYHFGPPAVPEDAPLSKFEEHLPHPTPYQKVPSRAPSGRLQKTTKKERSKKTGSFRSAIRRLFSRKSKTPDPQTNDPSSPRHGYHRSDPTGIYGRDSPDQRASLGPKTLSMPAHAHPLRQSPLNLSTHQVALEFPTSRGLKPLDLSRHVPQRRATIASTVFPDGRPSTARTAEHLKDEDSTSHSMYVPERTIGLALTRGDRRKSRSAEDLLAAAAQQSPERPERSIGRRSDEIRYWRASVSSRPFSGSSILYRFATSDDQTDPMTPVRRSRANWPEDETSPRRGGVFAYSGVPDEVPEFEQHEDVAVLEDSSTVGGLSHEAVLAQQPTLWPPYPPLDQQPQESVRGGDGSFVSVSPPPTFLQSPSPHQQSREETPQPGPREDRNTYDSNTETPKNSTYIQGIQHQDFEHLPIASQHIPHDSAHFPPDSPPTLESLAALLVHEQAARARLEALVQDLSREVASHKALVDLNGNQLKRLSVRTGESRLPTPSPDADKGLFQGQWNSGLPTSSELQEGLANVKSRFSGFESEIDDDESHDQSAAHTHAIERDNMESPADEVFETPTEEMATYDYKYDHDMSSEASNAPSASASKPSKIPRYNAGNL